MKFAVTKNYSTAWLRADLSDHSPELNLPCFFPPSKRVESDGDDTAGILIHLFFISFTEGVPRRSFDSKITMASRMLARRTAPALRHHLLSGSENATAAASTFSTKYAYAPQQQQRRSLRQRREFWTGGSFPDGRPGGDVSVTAVGLDGRLHRLNAPTGSIESTPHNLTDWIVWRLAKVPKGESRGRS